MSVRDALGNYIRDKLNTFAENNGVAIDLAIDINKQQERYEIAKMLQVNALGIEEYAPAVLTFDSTPTGKASLDKTIWGITLDIGIPTLLEDTDFLVNTKQALEDLRLELRQNSLFTVTTGAAVYNCKSRATDLTRIELVEYQAGYSYIRYQMGISVVSGIGIKFGDDELYELQKQTGSSTDFLYTDIGVFQKNGGTGNEYNFAQLEGEDLGKYHYQRGNWQDQVTCNHDDNLIAFVDIYNKAMDNTAPSEIYDLRITPPTGGSAINKRVFMEVNRVSNSGEDIQYVIKFREARE